MNENEQDCNHGTALICNKCMTKQLAHLLMKNGTNVNTISHITREINRALEDPAKDGFMCISCNENLATLCASCYSKRVKEIVYTYLPRGFSDRLLSVN